MTLQDTQGAAGADLADDEPPVEPLPPEARRALPMVWLVIATVTVALFVAIFMLAANPSLHIRRGLMTPPGAAQGPSVSHP